MVHHGDKASRNGRMGSAFASDATASQWKSEQGFERSDNEDLTIVIGLPSI
jgi:hypothetical protein